MRYANAVGSGAAKRLGQGHGRSSVGQGGRAVAVGGGVVAGRASATKAKGIVITPPTHMAGISNIKLADQY